MQKPKILITGGAGYIGSHTVSYLKDNQYPVVILDNLSYGHKEFVDTFLQVPLYIGDISDGVILDRIFTEHKIEAVMHFSAFINVGESVTDPLKYYQNNVSATVTLLSKMKEYNINKFIFSSTCATYGVPEQMPITETEKQNPINSYGTSKLMVEQVLKDCDIAHNLKSIIFRYFNAAGAHPSAMIGEDHHPETHLIPLVLDAMMGRRKEIQIYGTDYNTKDGTCVRDYIHVSDLANAHFLGLEFLLKNEVSDAFNLGVGQGFTVREIINAAEKIVGKKVPIVEIPRRAGDHASLISDSTKAKNILGWIPKITNIETIIEDAWRWHQKRFGAKR